MSSSLRISALVFFVSAVAAAGGNEVGNGGNAVICPKRVELLDIYEAKHLRKQSPSPAIRGNDPYVIALDRVAKLARVDAKSAKIFGETIEWLRKEISFEDSLTLKPIDDSKHAFEPSDAGCHVEQLAVFRKQPLPGEKQVLVNGKVWKRLAPLHQAGLLLHESIYRYLAALGEVDSTKVRYLNAYLLGPEIETVSGANYWKMIKDLRLPIYP